MECALLEFHLDQSQQCQQQTASNLIVVVALLETPASKALFMQDLVLSQCLSCHHRTCVMLMIYKHRIKENCNMCQISRDPSDLAGLATDSQNIKRYLFRRGHLCLHVYWQINVCKRSFYHTQVHTVHNVEGLKSHSLPQQNILAFCGALGMFR